MTLDPRLIWTGALLLTVCLVTAVGLNEKRRLTAKRQDLVLLLKNAGFTTATTLLSDDGLTAAAVDWHDNRLIFASLANRHPFARVVRAPEIKGADLLVDDHLVARTSVAGREDLNIVRSRPPTAMALRLHLGPPDEIVFDLCLLSAGTIVTSGTSADQRHNEALRFLDRLTNLFNPPSSL